MQPVSVVVPCHNAGESVFETIASVRAQSYRKVELILVNDGAGRPESRQILERASRLADACLEIEGRGIAAARNAGFDAAKGEFVVPLDAGDTIAPEYVDECLRALEFHPSAAFAYTGIQFFGAATTADSGTDYNLYRLLDSNNITCTALVRKADWRDVRGYDEAMRQGGEDWEFWLRMGARGRYGVLVPKRLFRRYRPPSSRASTRGCRADMVRYIQRQHPELYSYEARVRIKAAWQPAVCICGPHQAQTIEDIQTVDAGSPAVESHAPAYLYPGPGSANPQAAELAALAIWGGRTTLQFPDRSAAVSKSAARSRPVCAEPAPRHSRHALSRGWLCQHLINAELNSWNAWLCHPLRSAMRLVPLRLKERVNQGLGRPVFDLSFYLQFQPSSVLAGNSVVEPLRYMPRAATRRRIALVTPHLGPGGAEKVLLDIAASLERDTYELLLLATHSRDDRWADRWRAAADHVYDLAPLVPPRLMSAAIYSIVTNWQCEAILVQNCLFSYAALPLIRKDAPRTRILDLLHGSGDDWDQIAATAAVSSAIDVRVAISDEVRRRLLRAGVPGCKVRLIRNGVDLQRFRPSPRTPGGVAGRVLFAGRLDRVKRPLLLVDIAERLAALRAGRDFRIVVAGDGPELPALKTKARRRRVEDLFEFLGLVDDMAPVFANADVLILPSREEGMPLVVLEAMASGRPVVASKVGAIGEAVTPACAILVEGGKGEIPRFAAALDRLLSDRPLREEMGQAGRSKAEAEFDSSPARAAWRQLFD